MRVNGRDVEPGAQERNSYTLACRVYRTDSDLSGHPPEIGYARRCTLRERFRAAAPSHAPRAKGSHPSILSGTRSRAIGFVGLLPIRAGSDRDATGAFLGARIARVLSALSPSRSPLDQGEVETADEARVTGG